MIGTRLQYSYSRKERRDAERREERRGEEWRGEERRRRRRREGEREKTRRLLVAVNSQCTVLGDLRWYK